MWRRRKGADFLAPEIARTTVTASSDRTENLTDSNSPESDIGSTGVLPYLNTVELRLTILPMVAAGVNQWRLSIILVNTSDIK